ncbi:MucB/RseB C-terminal domain-containing protein [Aquitalea denitrificans]|uniref:MucB/RseB C-terminal domain-containing protein n=1 Tax=Aquitalea denitrificans TaxID=519081 RepID=UPI00135C9091|nr:MucB/RseB C-terminal domain-containing protein [Aquitalea denitrificans]
MRLTQLSGVCLMGVAMLAHADDDWLVVKRAAVAARQQPLTGTYLHQMNGSLETFRIVRGGTGDNIQEKRTSLDGPSREIIRKGLELTCYAPDAKSLSAAKVSAMRLFPAILPDDIGNIAQSYTLKRSGKDRVAQRDCNWMDLKPRDSKRYLLRLCVEPVSNLPLKVITQNAAGDAVEQFTFTEIELQGPKDKSAFRPQYKQNYVLRSANAPQMTLDADAPSEVSGMPSGFKLLRAVQRSLPGQAERTIRHMVFSDGLVMLSLFIEPQTDGRAERAVNLHGAVNMATAVQGDYLVTLVGDLPEPTMLAMIRNLKITLKP